MKHCPFFIVGLLLLLNTSCSEPEVDDIQLASIPETPELFASGLVSTGLYERDIAIHPSGEEIIYTLGDYKQSKRCLVSIRMIEGDWQPAQVLNISGRYQDIEPFFANEGQRLFFASNRPLEKDSAATDYNIWYSDREGEAWGEPIPLNGNINTAGDEFYPSVAKNGNLYFTATKEEGIGREDIYIARFVDGKYQRAEVLDSTINSLYYEFNAYVSPDEDMLIFSSYGRPDDLGGGDLYIARKNTAGAWLPAKNMGPSINSEKLDYCPFVDIARNTFYFTSERMTRSDTLRIRNINTLQKMANTPGNGMGDIYRVVNTGI
ncbi:MAG: TolB family protein [Lewinella sp.]|uniref:TolB family protein n=1 Tax=Lewinella sp. TaxID=2004506 RepID=UPI003D6A949F